MRPLPGDDAHARPRSSDADGPSTFRLAPAPQMVFSLGDEAAVGASSQAPLGPHRRAKEHRAAPHAEPSDAKPRVPSHHDSDRDKDAAPPPWSTRGLRIDDGDAPRPASPILSQPLTPVLPGASGPASALSSMSSRRNSLCLSEDLPSCPPSMKDEDVAVEDDDEAEGDQGDPGAGTASCSSMMDSGSAPQLVMPSIKMPSRRPFTDDGKRMGRLKVLVAGDSGVGKTSLIKAIVQSCDHIVHVDPITPSALLGPSARSAAHAAVGGSPGGARLGGSRRRSSRESSGTTEITEIYASTKPYPEWWSEVDDFRVLRRRKSLGDAVLDRNICFVDTPGYGSGSSSMDTITPVAQYIEAHLQRMSSNYLTDGDILNLVGGEGGVQVDAVFYLVSNRLRPVDIEYLRQLSPLTNIILLLAQADLMSPEQIAASKEQICGQLREADIRLFSFSMPSPHHPASEHDKHAIYAISSIAGSDHDTMDASLLMSPDYVQPLIPTELCSLVSHVFSPNGVSWLRHSVARKYVQWRKSGRSSSPSSSPSRGPSLPRLLTLPPSLASSSASLVPSNLLSSHPPPAPMGAAPSYALARLADHTQREERLAQVRLANWAADLQKSLAREREQYARLARGERAMWLAERIGECVRDGSLVVADRPGGTGTCTGTGPDAGRSTMREAGQEEKRDWEQGGLFAGSGTVSSSPSPSPSRSPAGTADGRQWSGARCGKAGCTIPHDHGHGHGQGQNQNQNQNQGQSQRHRQDPLGLLEVAADLRRKGLVALEVLGSIGVLGGLALWVTRHYFHLQVSGWVAGEWERFWNGPR